MNFRSDHNSRGFTLIEIIVTLVIISVLGTMIYTFFGQAFSESMNSISQLKKSVYLHKIMENITADYNIYAKWKAGTNYAQDNIVIPVNMNGHSYKCKSPGGISGSSEPDWKTGTDTPDNTATWTDNGQPLALATLKIHVDTPNYYQTNVNDPPYYVTENKFIQFTFDTNTEVNDISGLNKILKVTIRNDLGQTLTALFLTN